MKMLCIYLVTFKDLITLILYKSDYFLLQNFSSKKEA